MPYALTETGPLDRFWDFRREFDRLFDEAFPFGRPEGSSATFAPSFDWQEDENGLTLQVEVPGVEPDKLVVSVTGRVLTLEGERWSKSDDKNGVQRSERRFGKFSRSVHLPEQYDLEAVEAKHENGILTLRIPKSEAAKPRAIRIETR